MAHIITIPEMGLILDSFYRNYGKPKIDQKSIQKLSVECAASVATIQKVRNILHDQKLLIMSGERRGQLCYWHPDKSAPNQAMLTNVYSIYTKNIKSKVKIKRKQQVVSEQRAIEALIRLGWKGEIFQSYTKEYVKHTKTIDLSEVVLGEWSLSTTLIISKLWRKLFSEKW